MTWGVNNENIFNVGWTIPLSVQKWEDSLCLILRFEKLNFAPMTFHRGRGYTTETQNKPQNSPVVWCGQGLSRTETRVYCFNCIVTFCHCGMISLLWFCGTPQACLAMGWCVSQYYCDIAVTLHMSTNTITLQLGSLPAYTYAHTHALYARTMLSLGLCVHAIYIMHPGSDADALPVIQCIWRAKHLRWLFKAWLSSGFIFSFNVP